VGRFAALGFVLAALTLGLVQPVAAQVNHNELTVGYSSLFNNDLAVNADSLPVGFFFDADFALNDWISVSGELNGHFKSGIEPSASTSLVVPPLPTQDFQVFSFNRPEIGFCSPAVSDCDVDIQTISGVGGPRFHLTAGRARPFFHVMAGATRSLRKIEFFAHTSTNFTIQPGVGVDVDMTDRMALHVQGDYRRVFFGVPDQTKPGASLVSKDGTDSQEVIFAIGVAFKLGQVQ
jgi:Outer membrane protein beta-barrel domain